MPEKLLLIDGARSGSDGLAELLQSRGFTLAMAHSSKQALERVQEDRPDLIVLDTTAARFNGRRLCATLYHRFDVPIIAIVGRKGPELEQADVNVAIPISMRRLTAAIRRILRIKQPWIMRQGELVLDLKKRTVARGGRARKLRPMEARLLRAFMRRPSELITRAELMKAVWDTDFTGDTRTLDVHVRWVRERIEDDPSDPQLLVTVRGQGYRLEI